jgi:hypothetical protein
MEAAMCYRGQTIGAAEIAFLRQLIAAQPTASRRRLSTLVCQAWQWAQPNGVLKTMVCRGLLLRLHRKGLITLPPKQHDPPNPLTQRRRPAVESWPLSWEPVPPSLAALGPIELRPVRRTPEEKLFDGLLEQYHYLAYTQPVGEHLKYLVWAGGTPLACLAWSSAPRHLEPRDQFIGWTAAQRRERLHGLAYNTRYLILPWARVPHLASYVLARMARVLSADWQQRYAHPIYWLETFIDPARFASTCYRAANWICLGRTTGRGKDDLTHRSHLPLKELWGYPLVADFRQHLCGAYG